MNALEWGRSHGSCAEAMRWRESLGPEATQADAWRGCPRSDWLWWQLGRLPAPQRRAIVPALVRAVGRSVERAVRAHALHCGTPAVEAWAVRWLDGTDRCRAAAAWVAWAAASEEAAARVAWAAAAAAWVAWAAADDIRAEIPEWPGEVDHE